MPPPKAKEKEKYIKMREPKEIQEPLKTVRNTKTKLLRQATPEEIIKLAIKAEVNKKAAEKAKEIEAAAKEASDAKEEKAATEAKAEEEKKVETAALEATKAEAEKKTEAEEAVKAEEAAKADAALKALPDQTFYWVKNAESVANLYNNEETDTYSNKDAQKALNEEKRTFRENNTFDLSEYNLFETEGGAGALSPPITPSSAKPAALMIKRNHSKFPITDDLKEWIKKLFKNKANFEKIQTKYAKIGKICDPATTEYDFKKCLKQVQADFKGEELQQAYAILLMSISFYTFIQPTLSEGGMVQARILGEQIIKRKLIELQPETSIILCAATVPAMMTAYLTAGYAELPNAQIYIVPYLNEKESEETKLFFNGSKNLRDFANYAISPKVISEVGAKILAWFADNQIYDANGALLNVISKDINKNKPLFDYTYYPTTGEGDDALREGDLTKFFTWFDATIKDKPNVLVFSHDTPVKEVRKQTFLNTKIDDKPIDDANPLIWNANTSVFQHKRQGGILRPIFPADAVPKLSAPPFPPELAQCGLIYYPNNGVEKTTIRNRKDLEKEPGILLMDNFNEEENQNLISKSIMTEANDLGLRAELNSIIHGEDLDKKGAYEKWEADMQRKVEVLEYRATDPDANYLPKTYIEPKPEYMTALGYETPTQQTKYLEDYRKEYEAELENIKKMIAYFSSKLAETKEANDIDPIMEEEVKTVEQRLIDYKKKYSEPLSAPVDDKAKLKAKLEEEITKAETVKLQELHALIDSFIGSRTSPANLLSEKTKMAEIAAIKEKKKKVTNDEASDTLLEKYKKEYIIAGGGGRSKKKRNKRPKKSIRKNPKQKKNKSKKKKGKKLRKRTFKKQPLKKVAPNI